MDTSSRPAHTVARSRSMLRIFLSSSSVDLQKHRDAVRHVVDLFDEHPVVMGDFGARDGDATEISLERVRSCDVYVLLLGWRYGTIPPGETLSVTHLEYHAARDAGMPRLIFLADPETEKDDGPDALFPATVRNPELATNLRAFREEVGRENVAAFFTTPDNAAALVAPALHHIIAAMLPSGPHPPNKLAPRAPGFVGREGELQLLCQRLRAGQSVGLSVLVAGLAGVGKSALAAEALYTLAAEPDAFPGGITWARCDERVGLGGLTWLYDQFLADWGAQLAPEQLAQAQIVGPEAEVELRERALQARLHAFASDNGALPPALALLDNVEVGLPLARALETLATLGITALVTARHRPSVARLQLLPLDVLEPTAAAQLFAERYRAKDGAWDDARDSDAAAAIVERLGRLPLAIELQAARAALRQVSVAQLSADLERDRSQGLLGDALDATRNMRYSFDQSLKTLTPLQRTRLAALGLPDGPDWPRAVIERLLAGIQEQGETPENTEPSVSALAAAEADLDIFAALSLASLLLPDGRVRLHPLLREYAHELWQNQSSETQAQGLRALLAGIVDLVVDHEHDFAALAIEEEMIVAALDQAQATQAVPQYVIGIVDTLFDYLNLGGHWRLAMRLISWQLAACREVDNRSGEGTTLNNLGELVRRLGQPEQSRSYYEQALIIVREVGNRNIEGTVLNNLGGLASGLGDKEQARDYFEQALVIRREVGDRRGESIILSNLGELAGSLGQPEQAHTFFEQALAIAQEVGDRIVEGAVLSKTGNLVYQRGEYATAVRYCEQALAILREVGDRASEGGTLSTLGNLANSLGQEAEAYSYYDQALTIAREVGDLEGEGAALNNLGSLTNQQGEHETAIHYYDQALAIARKVSDRAGEERTLSNLGHLANYLGQSEQARSYYDQALTIAREVGDRTGEGIILSNLGVLDRDERQIEQALTIAREVGDLAGEGTALNNLGELVGSLGQKKQARDYFERALAIFQEIEGIEDIRRVISNLRILAQSPHSPVIHPSKSQRYGRRRHHHKKGTGSHSTDKL